MALLAQSTFTIRRLAKDELNLVFSSDTVAIPSKNGVADLSTAEFEVKVLKGGRELFPVFDEEIGGRNYYPNTTSDYREITFSGWQYYLHYINIGGDAPLQVGDNIVWSGYVQAGGNHLGIMLDYLKTDGSYTQIQSNFITPNEEGKVVGYSTIPEGVNKVRLALRHNIGTAPIATHKYKDLKIEKGNKATDWTPAPEEVLTNATLSAHNCTAVVDGSKIKLTSIESGKNAGYVDVTVTYGEGNNITRRFTWARAETGISVTNVDVEYAVNSNTSTAPTTGWSTLPPVNLTSGQQLWTRTVTFYGTGSPTYSVPANITPQVGQGVDSIIEEFAISTSKTTQPTTGWSTTPPTWVNGSYIWTRTKITYKNPAHVVYTGYAVSSEWEAVNELEIGGRNLLLNSNFKTTSFNGWSNIYGTQQITENGYLKTYTEVFSAARIEKIFHLDEVGIFTFSVKVKTDLAISWDGWVGLAILNINIKQIEDGFEIHSITLYNSNAGNKTIRGYQRNAPIGTTVLIEWEQLEKGNKATDWSPAPEDVQAEIDSKVATSTYTSKMTQLDTAIAAKVSQTDFNALGQRVSTAEGTLTTQAGLIAAKAEASSVTALGTRVTTAENTIDAHTGQINSKVSKTDYNANNTAIQNQFSNISQRADGIELSVTNVNNKVDDIEIGGRNLVQRSDEFNGGHNGANGITSSLTSEGYLRVVSTSGNGNWFTSWAKSYTGIEDSFNEGDQFTISFTMKSPDHTKIPTIYLKSGMGYYPLQGVMSTKFNTFYYSGIWKKANPLSFHLGFSGVVGTTIIKNWKIEKGNKATDWTPAIEDTQSDYESKIKQAADSISLAVYNKTLDALNPATELKLTSSSIKLTVAGDIAAAKSEAISAAATDATTKANNAKAQAISAAATDATNKVNGLKTDLSGTGIDIVAGTLTLYSGAKDGNAGGKVVIAGSNFSVDAEGKVKAVDGEFSGKISATEGTIGSMHLQSNMLVSSSEKLTIDGTNSTITLKDASSDDVRILIKPNNLPTSPSSYFGSTTKSASFTAIKSTITATGTILSSNPITVGANESYTFNIPSVTLTASVTVPETMNIRIAAVATAELYLTDGMLEVPIGNARAASFFGRGSDVTVIPATTRTITSTGNWRLQLRYKLNRGGFSPDQVSGSAQLTSSSSTYSAVPIVNRSEFGANGLIVATSANEYTYMVGNTFEVRRQNHMFRVTSSDIQISKNGGGRWESLHSGLLGVVHFTLGGGITYQWTKNGAPITLSYTTSNPFRVNHNFGHTNYFAIPIAQAKYGYLWPENMYSNYCTISKKDDIGSGHQITVLLIGNG